MPSKQTKMKDKAENALFALIENMRDVATDVVVERFTRPKYEEAREAVLGVLDQRIADLRTKPKPTQRDSELLGVLMEVRTDIEAALAERWSNRPEFGDRE